MPELTLIIGNKNYSSWSLRPWIFLKQHNIKFLERRVALFTDTTAQELATYNSDSKVPVLKDGELLIWDTLAILEYVSETYLDSAGWPEERDTRAVARSVSNEMHSSFMNLRNEMPMNCRKKFKHIELSSGALSDINRVKLLWRQCRTQFGQEGEWLFGRYSIADAMFAPIALRFDGYNISLGDIENTYVRSVLGQADIQEWIASGVAEKEII